MAAGYMAVLLTNWRYGIKRFLVGKSEHAA